MTSLVFLVAALMVGSAIIVVLHLTAPQAFLWGCLTGVAFGGFAAPKH
jgi:hypothetical protein